MRPMLLPGTHVLRRGPGRLQAGLSPARSVASADDRPDQLDHQALRAGLALADDRPLRDALPALQEAPPWQRHGLAALGRRHPDDLTEVLARRRQHVVVVEPCGHALDARIVEDVDVVLGRAGLRRPGRVKPGPGPREKTTDVGLLLGVGEPQRERVDPWVRRGRPHLLLRWVEGEVLLGPFVLPGRTPCLRCLDAHRTEEDPSWPLLVEQYARVSRLDRPDGVPEPVDPALAALAVGWAVADLATYAGGGRPTTLGATVRVTSGMEQIVTTRWRRHPACGCDWS